MKKVFSALAALVVFVFGWYFSLDWSAAFSSKNAQKRPVALAAASVFPFGGSPDSLFKKAARPQKTVRRLPIGQVENVVWVTLDGLRWQEVFGGIDSILMRDEKAANGRSTELEADFWANSPEKRREKLLPFFWKTIARDGQLHGNRWRGSRSEVANSFWISYPGYAEMLSGLTDGRICSNRKIENPHPTVLEFLAKKEAFRGRVAAFASWDVFNEILAFGRGGVHVSAGPKAENCPLAAALEPWPGVREDALTMRTAMRFLKKRRPRAAMISLDGTDDAMHDGDYSRAVRYAAQADRMVARLWDFLQKDPFYRGRTALIVTTDHGRGSAESGNWKSHGRLARGSNQTWMAFLGPCFEPFGEADSTTLGGKILFQKDLAPTVAALLGEDFRPDDSEPGQVVRGLFRKRKTFGQPAVRPASPSAAVP